MRKILALLAICAAPVFPAYTYLDFAGFVVRITGDSSGRIASQGVHVDDSIHYVFAVDTSAQGYVRRTDGTRIEIQDTVDSEKGSFQNIFFDSLMTPPLLSQSTALSTQTWYSGTHESGGPYISDLKFMRMDLVGSRFVTISVQRTLPTRSLKLPAVGDMYYGVEMLYPGKEVVESQLHLISIGSVPPASIRGRIVAGRPPRLGPATWFDLTGRSRAASRGSTAQGFYLLRPGL